MLAFGRTTALFAVTFAAILLIGPSSSAADGLPLPQGHVILTVSGNIANTNKEGQADFDLEMLHALGTHSLAVTTSWTDGTQEFSGVLMRDLMKAVGARGTMVEAVALNDYTYSIPIEDFSRYPVILATALGGKILRIRDKGPLWIIYPLDSFTEVEKITVEPRMVWQLRRLIVK